MRLVKVCLAAIIVLAGGSQLAEPAGFVVNSHFFPIITRIDGQAGTHWYTEVTISNPQSFQLHVQALVASAGSVTQYTLSAPAMGTLQWGDFVGGFLHLGGNYAMALSAESADNGSRSKDCLGFYASVRVYNSGGSHGTYGQEVPPLDPVAGVLSSGWPAYFTGVNNYGIPGVSGFRTNIGFWNFDSQVVTVRARLYDNFGAMVWQENLSAPRNEPGLVSIPSNVVVIGGTLVIHPLGLKPYVAPYISVIDNSSGDASFRAPLLLNPSVIGVCGTGILSADAHPLHVDQLPEPVTALRDMIDRLQAEAE